jgi:aminopeptidase N
LDTRDDLREQTELSCGRLYGSYLLRERGVFALPGDRTHWPRDREFDLKHLRLEITLDPESKSLSGTASHTFAAINDGLKSVELDAVELRIGGVTSARGAALDHTYEDGKLRVALAAALNSGEESTINIAYSCTPRRGLYFNVPDDGYPERPRQVWTQGEDEDSRFWFPCYDSPNQRFTSEVIVTVPREWNAVSNGRLAGVAEDGSTKTYHWSQELEHPTYLMSLVAGEYTEIRDDWNGTPIVYYSPPGREDDTRRAFDKTPKMMRFFTERTGTPYPWAKYSQVTVADFIFGGMENTSATTMTDSLLHDERAHLDFSTDSIVAHELAHQWWGDLLTCRDWSHGWLNEGFATYFDLLFKEHDLGVDEFRYGVYQDAQTYLEEDSGSYRRPIVSSVYNQPVDLFDRHLYEKGGLVLHMLRFVLGDALFWKAMAHYCRACRGKSVTTEDLQRSIEESTGRNLDWFFHQWVYMGGHPDLKAAYTWDEESGAAQLAVSQTQTTDDLTPLFRMPVDLVFVTSAGRDTRRVTVSEAQQTFHFSLAEKPVMVSFDPGYWCLKTLEFSRPKEMMIHQLEHDEDVIGRVQAAQDLGKIGSLDCIQALKKAVLNDAFWGVQAQAARALGRTRSDSAMEALIECAGVPHPKGRRAVVSALGEFKEQAALEALAPLLESDASYFVEAEAARAVARTEQPGAFELVAAALGRPSVNDVMTVQAFAGLGALRDERAIPLAKEWAAYGRPNRAREAALACLGKLGEGKRDVVELLQEFVDDPWLRARIRAIDALQELKDDRAVPALSRRIQGELDGRVVRRSREAIAAIRRGRDRGDDARKLREDLEKLQEDNRKLRDRLDKLEAGTGS